MKKLSETVDQISAYGLQIIQPQDGYRFSLDPLLLCDFAAVTDFAKIIDLGTGSAVIPLILARKNATTSIVAVELQAEMAEMARRNTKLNQLDQQIEIISADIITLKKRYSVSLFDLVVSNPPYRTSATGRISPKAGRDLARHESTAKLADFLSIAKYLVKPAGRICFISHPSRLAEFIQLAGELKLALVRLRMVHPTSDSAATMFLAELAKASKAGAIVEPPTVVHL